MSITEKTFALVHDRLQALNYHGPIALSCDDTKLDPSWRLCESQEDQSLLLVGAVGGPITVVDEAEVQHLIDAGTSALATKVRASYNMITCLILSLTGNSPFRSDYSRYKSHCPVLHPSWSPQFQSASPTMLRCLPNTH